MKVEWEDGQKPWGTAVGTLGWAEGACFLVSILAPKRLDIVLLL